MGALGFRHVGFLFMVSLAIALLVLVRVPALDDFRGIKPRLDCIHSIPCECFGLLGIRMSLYHGFANAYRSIGQLDGA